MLKDWKVTDNTWYCPLPTPPTYKLLVKPTSGSPTDLTGHGGVDGCLPVVLTGVSLLQVVGAITSNMRLPSLLLLGQVLASSQSAMFDNFLVLKPERSVITL